ncbi:hypothetical protein [Mucilaginibacter sp. dw_454]|uniref:hypothetical protein n=1 Tax=Mucilaginibacter sp. dw_454 TaxID=2720079 RepID=UPI001BD67268|nr:hypothetical protein [Mucilaginibacter sp. dw_454]
MTWIKFICWLSGLYAFYYMGNILWDLSRSRKASGEIIPELVFEEQAPQKVAIEAKAAPKMPEKAKPPVTDSGGVRLKQLFQLAKAESIVYTGAVSY